MHGLRGCDIVGRHGAAALAIVAAVAFRFHRLVFQGVSLLNDEVADEYYPLAANVFAHMRRGELPLWSPEILFGYPLATTVDLHLFSPFGWPHLLFPPHVALGLQMLSVQLVAAFSMYALARGLDVSALGAVVAAVLWVTGCPADNLALISMGLATVPWIPLVILAWHQYCRQRDLRWAIVSGGVLGLAMLGGHMQFVYWTLFFLAGHLLLVLGGRNTWRADVKLGLRGLTVMGLVAAATAAVIILPMRELLDDSIRTSLAPDQRVHTGRLSLADTWRALRWTVFCGRDPVHTLFEGDIEFRSAGVLPVALALLAWGRGRRFDNRLLAMAVVFLVLSLGAVFAPSHWIVTWLPGNNFRYPGRIGLFFTLAVVLLAGRAVDRLLAGDARRGPNRITLAAFALLCAPAIGTLLRSHRFIDVSEGARDVAALALLGAGLALPSAGRYRDGLRRALVVTAVGWGVFHSQVMTYTVSRWETARAWGDQAGMWSHRRGVEERFPPDDLLQVPRHDEHGPTRVLDVATPWEHDLPLLTGHHAPTGLVSLRPGRIDRLVYARNLPSDSEHPLTQTLLANQGLLDLFNVQYVALDPAEYERTFDAARRRRSMVLRQALGSVALVENRTHLPRSFFVTHARTVATEEEARAGITAAGFNPRREVLLEGAGSETSFADSDAPLFRAAAVTAYENERVEVTVDAPREGWLVLLDRWAPGWSARVMGRAVPILRADYLFRAVRVPAGRHQVVFEYDNPHFRRGLVVSALGMAAALGAAVSLWRSRRG